MDVVPPGETLVADTVSEPVIERAVDAMPDPAPPELSPEEKDLVIPLDDIISVTYHGNNMVIRRHANATIVQISTTEPSIEAPTESGAPVQVGVLDAAAAT